MADLVSNFPNEYARSQRFTCGAPRNFSFVTSSQEKKLLFLRSEGPYESALRLWQLDMTTGEETLLVDPKNLHRDQAALTDAEKSRRERFRESASGITSYLTDKASLWVCFSLNSSLFLFNRADEVLIDLSANGVNHHVFDPRISPDGKKIAYIADNSLCCLIRKDDKWNDFETKILLESNDDAIRYGQAEFIAAEEMRRTRGFWWSPQSDHLLATKVDETAINTWWVANPANPSQTPQSLAYPKAGSTNAAVDLLLIDLKKNSQKIVWQTDEEANQYEYLVSVQWREEKPLITRQSRDQKLLNIAAIEGDPLPVCKTQTTITDDHWVEIIPTTPRQTSKGLLTIEDFGDRRHLCLDGKPFSTDEITIIALLGVKDDVSKALVSAYGQNPTEIHTFSIAIATGTATQLSDAPGVHKTIVSDNVVLVSSATIKFAGTKTWIGELSDDWGRIEPAINSKGQEVVVNTLASPPPITLKPQFHLTTEKNISSVLLLPEGHDGATLPVLLDPYGGPHAQRVLQTYNAHSVSQWFANQGYAVLVTDGRGTPGKGPAWEKAIAGDLAVPVLEDQINALDAVAERYNFLDLKRVGIRGWSFGGYLAALAVLRRPDRFHAAVAGAPVTDWRLYDTHYTERYLGHPEHDAANYQKCDLTDAPELTRPLLLIHGLADDNVVAAHTLKLSSALLSVGAPHTVLPLSGVTHMTPQHSIAENLLHLQVDFLHKNL